MPSVRFSLNGRPVSVPYEPGESLLTLLRERCGVASLKAALDVSDTGLDTILLDGRPELASRRTPVEVEERAVVTQEGLRDEERRLFAEALVGEGAVDCGYCTPALVVRAAWLFRTSGTAEPSALERALAGHRCPCGLLGRAARAITAGGHALQNWIPPAPGRPAAPRPPVPFAAAGDPAPRAIGVELALGLSHFVTDLHPVEPLHGAPVMANRPAARVVSVDSWRAATLDGVRFVLTAADVPGERFPGARKDRAVFVAPGETTGGPDDIVAFVVAEDRAHALAAAAAVEVTYEDGAAPAGVERVVARFVEGDVAAALAAAAHVAEGRFAFPASAPTGLEPLACVAVPERNRLRVFSQGQAPGEQQAAIAAALSVAPEAVSVEALAAGGWPAGRLDAALEVPTALAARILGSPVVTVLGPLESRLLAGEVPAVSIGVTAGADKGGLLTALRVNIRAEAGPDDPVAGALLGSLVAHARGPYAVPNVEVEARAVAAPRPRAALNRTLGADLVASALEAIVDELAGRVGLDRYEVRQRNLAERAEDGLYVGEALAAVKDVFEGAGKAGIACGLLRGLPEGAPEEASVRLCVLPGGRVDIQTGFAEAGEGIDTLIRQVVVGETRLPAESLTIRTLGDAELGRGASLGAAGLILGVSAAREAAQKLGADLQMSPLDAYTGHVYRGYARRTAVPPASAAVVATLDASSRLSRIIVALDVGRPVNPALFAAQVEGAVVEACRRLLGAETLAALGVAPVLGRPRVEVRLVDGPPGGGMKGSAAAALVPLAGCLAGLLAARAKPPTLAPEEPL